MKDEYTRLPKIDQKFNKQPKSGNIFYQMNCKDDVTLCLGIQKVVRLPAVARPNRLHHSRFMCHKRAMAQKMSQKQDKREETHFMKIKGDVGRGNTNSKKKTFSFSAKEVILPITGKPKEISDQHHKIVSDPAGNKAAGQQTRIEEKLTQDGASGRRVPNQKEEETEIKRMLSIYVPH